MTIKEFFHIDHIRIEKLNRARYYLITYYFLNIIQTKEGFMKSRKSILNAVLCSTLSLALLACPKNNNQEPDASGPAMKTNSNEIPMTFSAVNSVANSENLVQLNKGTSEVIYTIPAENVDTILNIAEIKVTVNGRSIDSGISYYAYLIEGTQKSASLKSGSRIKLDNNTNYKIAISSHDGSYINYSKNITVNVIAVRKKISDNDLDKTIRVVRNCEDSLNRNKKYKVVFSVDMTALHSVTLSGGYYSTDLNLGIQYAKQNVNLTPKICGKPVDPSMMGYAFAQATNEGEIKTKIYLTTEKDINLSATSHIASYTTRYLDLARTLQFSCEIKGEKQLDIKMTNCSEMIEVIK